MPAVSVVTTTLNRTQFLRQAIESALNQTFTDFELLVCDDGGLAETRRVCESFHDSRILHTVNPARLGIAMNTYSGIQRSRSDLVVFLNDDDRWTKNYLAKCATPLIEDPEVALVFSDHWLINSHGERLIDATAYNTRAHGREHLAAGPVADPVRLMARLTIPVAMAALFRKSRVDWSRYSRKVDGAYDSYIAYSLLLHNGKVIYIPERLTEYRTHGGGASAEFHRDTSEGLAYVHSLILHDPAYRAIKSEIRGKYLSLERHLAKLGLSRFDLCSAVRHCANFARHAIT